MDRSEISRRLEAFQGSVDRGDADLNPGMRPMRDVLTPAAVLVPLVTHDNHISMLLTQRTDHLHDHAGQISFPGGRVEESDRSVEHTALRETEEEVGLPASHIEVIGRLDRYITRTGFDVTPVVGFVRPPYPVEPDPFEVADVFEVPLSFLLDRRNHQRHSRVFQGKERFYYAMPYEDRFIWGATAGMLVNLVDILMDHPGEASQ